MSNIVHIYCDESCHLEKDHQKVMVLGAVTCPAESRWKLGRKIKALKQKHGIPQWREIKWTQVSPSRQAFYVELVDLFFDEPSLGFRTVVVPDKKALRHEEFNQTHDEFYYKMWWLLLTRLIDDEHCFRIFVDIKDTQSAKKLRKLHEILCSTHYDFDRQRILSIEAVRSHDVLLLQLADLLIGAVSHYHRNLVGSQAKQAVIERIRERSGLSLLKSTPPQARKFNIFIWKPQEVP
jgi:hypothetical protein